MSNITDVAVTFDGTTKVVCDGSKIVSAEVADWVNPVGQVIPDVLTLRVLYPGKAAEVATALEALEEAHEILRGALDLLTQAGRGPYVKNVLSLTTKANGGGDGHCLREEIEAYFDQHGIAREFQRPEDEE